MSNNRVDIEELERTALRDMTALDGKHGDPARRGSWVGHRDFARAVVALVARVRELEGGYRQLMHDYVRDADERPMHALLDKGVVLP